MDSISILYGVGILLASGLGLVSGYLIRVYDDNPFILVLRAVGHLLDVRHGADDNLGSGLLAPVLTSSSLQFGISISKQNAHFH